MGRREKKEEPDPIPPPSHIPTTYNEYIKWSSKKKTSIRSTRTEADPFGFRNDLPSLRKDNRINNLIISKETIQNELNDIIPPEPEIRKNGNFHKILENCKIHHIFRVCFQMLATCLKWFLDEMSAYAFDFWYGEK